MKTHIKFMSMILFGLITIHSFLFDKEKNQISVIYQQPTYTAYPEGGVVPDKVWKEIYGVKNGKIVLMKKVEGKHIPTHIEHEKIIFEDENKDNIQNNHDK